MDSPPYHSPTRQTPQLPLRHHFSNHSPAMSQLMRSQSQLDEGFSEETRSQSGSEMMYSAVDVSDMEAASQKLLQQLMTLPAAQREYVIGEAVHTLDNDAKERIKRHIIQLTHFDPAHYLPTEVFLQIFSYLSPSDLLSASTISRDWRVRSQDEKLWRGCFAREGWVLDKSRLEAFERVWQKKGQKIAENLTRRSVPPLERRGSRKRKTEDAFSGDESPAGKAKVDVGAFATSVPNVDGTAEDSNGGSIAGNEDSMEGVEVETASQSRKSHDDETMPLVEDVTRANSQQSRPTSNASTAASPADLRLQPTLFQLARQDKLSWPYLYKQRRRLEANWEKGIYSMFQLPHRDYPAEGHEECVYTIQHTNAHLVSGSRDKTIRIWDLNTNRLKGKPLRGHDASVLCLHFDERPEHDLIVSGGSDAYVIIWRFSTGEIVKKMTKAHDESVLNLRFDDRYIVTCSKDKTIKIWSRHALARDSPLIPRYVLNSFNEPTAVNLASPIPEYSLLTSFPGHHAAVNAVMIHDDTIVSASGDRTIKAWDLHTGQIKKTYPGHQKGIACVQFDGRRIVSGSSDNSVRIFDAEQQAEIACLTGHNNLVRTVQARFGDLETTTDEELQAEARAADRRFYIALSKGMQPATASRRGPRNAGSSRPEDMQSVGTKIPPGGGGTRWAKIVSGSYDETVIVWKRDSEGKWQVKLRLHQDQLLRASRAHRRRENYAAAAAAAPVQANGTSNAPSPHTANGGGNVSHPNQVLANAQSHMQQTQNSAQQPHQGGAPLTQHLHLPVIADAQQQMNTQLNHASQRQHETTVTTTTAGPTTPFTATQAHGSQQQNNGVQHPPQHNQHPFGNPITGLSTQQLQQLHAQTGGGSHPPPPPHVLQFFQPVGVPQVYAPYPGPQHHQAPPNAPPPGHANPSAGPAVGQIGRVSNESNRVFKLQFDARRIVCCSQNRTIVGWDFAAGDEELERIGDWSLETA